jgi:hypothetical protein
MECMEVDMGYAFVHSACYGCGRLISYNPHRVPSIRVEGKREPLCRDCVDKVNKGRIKNGLEPKPVHPDAYSPIPEEEL